MFQIFLLPDRHHRTHARRLTRDNDFVRDAADLYLISNQEEHDARSTVFVPTAPLATEALARAGGLRLA